MINDFIDFLEKFHERFPSPSDRIKTTWFSQAEHARTIQEIEVGGGNIPAETIIFAVVSPGNFIAPRRDFSLFLTEDSFYWGKEGRENRMPLPELRSVHFSVGMKSLTVNGQDYKISGIERYSEFDRPVSDWLDLLFRELIRFLHQHPVHIGNQTVETCAGEYSAIISQYLKSNPPPPSLYKTPSKERAAMDRLGVHMPSLSEIILLYTSENALWLLTGSKIYIHDMLIIPLKELISFEEKLGWSEDWNFECYLRINGMSRKDNANIPVKLLGPSGDQATLKYIINLVQYIIQHPPDRYLRRENEPANQTSPMVLEQILEYPSPASKTLQEGSRKIKEQQTVGNALLRWLGFIIYGPVLVMILFIGLGWWPDSFEELSSLYLIVAGILLAAGIYFCPAIIAFGVKHPHRWPILLVNLLFGITLIGWVGTFIWSFLFRESTKVHVILKRE